MGGGISAREVPATLQRQERRAANDGHVIAGELVLGEQFAHFQLHQFEQLFVLHHVHFVQKDHHGRHFHLARQQHMLARLGHGAIGSADHQDGAVHLGGSGDHVLDVVGMPGAVDVGVVALLGFVLQVGDGDGDAALALFGRFVNLVEGGVLGQFGGGQDFGDGGRQGGFAMVNVTDRAHVHMRFVALKFLLCHLCFLIKTVLGAYVLGQGCTFAMALYLMCTGCNSLHPYSRSVLGTLLCFLNNKKIRCVR